MFLSSYALKGNDWMYKRVLIKVSGEALSSKDSTLCAEKIYSTAKDLVSIAQKGVEIGVVCGGGNIMRGRSAGNMERNRADHMGMLATAINALALQDAIEQLGHKCIVMSAVDMPKFADSFTSRGAKQSLHDGSIVIFACGSGSPFFSTDTAAALRAAEINAEVLLLAKRIDGVYDKDPMTCSDAKKYSHLTYDKVIADELHATDLTAITLCKEQHIRIHVFQLDELLNVFEDEGIGTTIDDCDDSVFCV